MKLPPALSSAFSSSARARGEAYAESGRVQILSLEPHTITATVRGSEQYDVHLQDDPNGPSGPTLRVSCTCPHFTGSAEGCKHIWAVILTASWRGDTFLTAPASSGADVTAIAGTSTDAVAGAEDPDEADDDPFDPMKSLAPAYLSRLSSRDARALLRTRWENLRRGSTRARKPPPTPGQRLLQTVASSAGPPPPRVFPFAADELMYVLDLDAMRFAGLQLDVMTRQPRQNGTWSAPKALRVTAADLGGAPPDDALIIGTLAGSAFLSDTYGSYQLPHRFAISRVVAPLLLPRMAKTGRAFARATREASELFPLTWDDGAPWSYRVLATPQADGIVLSGRFERDADTLADADALAVLESGFLIAKTFIAPVQLSGSRALFSALFRHEPVALTSKEVSRLAETLAITGARSSELPEPLRMPEIDVPPIKLARLSEIDKSYGRPLTRVDVSFVYDGTRIAPTEPSPTWDPERRRVIRRHADIESAALRELSSAGVTRAWDPHELHPVFRLATSGVPRLIRTLMARGWTVESEGHLMQSPSRVTMSVASGIDWFDLEASVEFGDETVPLVDVLAALKKGDGSVALQSGAMGLLPDDWLRRYAPIAAMGEATDDRRIRFRLPQAALLDALLDAQADEAAVAIDARFDAARKALARFDRVAPIDPPASFQGTLRPYQKNALGWLAFLREFGFGGCLADDMGLGKTVMVLAMLQSLKEGPVSTRKEGPVFRPGQPRPSLVVAPRSVVHNWIAEAARFTPELRVRDISHATRNVAGDAVFEDVDVVITTYGTLRRDASALAKREFEYVILDEAQAIKNASTASAKAARVLRGRHHLALSGTPIENHLGELWSLTEFLNPGLLGRSSALSTASSARRTVDPETAELLSRALRPFILRRTKAQVATDLPPRTEQTIVCELEGKQRTFYNALRTHYRQTLLGRIDRMGLGKSKMHVLEALLRLRQAACHPGLVDSSFAKGPSAKLDVLLPRLREVIAEGHKALVFSQFTSFLAHVRATLDAEGVTYEYLDGQTTNRAAHVERFQTDPSCPVFLISLKAGGLGLNLTAAEYVFLLDPWWNPAVEAQAIDRAHRIGQTRHVMAYRLIAEDTVEEKVLLLQESKRALADAILRADAGLVGQLGREEIEMLLS